MESKSAYMRSIKHTLGGGRGRGFQEVSVNNGELKTLSVILDVMYLLAHILITYFSDKSYKGTPILTPVQKRSLDIIP